jgi:centromere protein O
MEVSDFEEETLKKRHKKNPFTSSMGEVVISY